MAKRKAMGRGLSEMIQVNEADLKKESSKDSQFIDINKIGPNSGQPRKEFDEEKLKELAESIKLYGIIEPIIVSKSEDDFYVIVAGERRWRAAKLAGVKKVPIVVKEYSTQEIMEIALIENVQREDLNPIEEAMAYDSLIKEYKLTQEQVATKVSKSRTVITNSLRLLKLDERVIDMIKSGELTTGHARALLGLKSKADQVKLAEKIVSNKLSVRETEKLVKQASEKKKAKKTKTRKKESVNDMIYQEYEQKLTSVMGSKVKINHSEEGSGKIEIDYYSVDDFERLMEIFTNITGEE